MHNSKFKNLIKIPILFILLSCATGYSAVSQTVGTAVVQGTNFWTNSKDAASGDNLTSGIPAVSMYFFDGTNFDRMRGSITNGLLVDVSQITGTVTIQGGSSDNSVNSTAKVSVIPARANAATPTWTEGNQVPLSVDLTGALRVNTGTTALPTTFTHNQVAVTAVATLVKAANASRMSLLMRNIGTNPVYVGSTVAVTTVNGFLIYPNESLTLDKNTGTLYAICSGVLTSTIAFIEE